MTEREALLRAVCENPDDDTPRLVFADWLDEHCEPERAEFIHLQIEAAHLTDRWQSWANPHLPHHDAQIAKILELHELRWRAAELPEDPGFGWGQFHRGFVDSLYVHLWRTRLSFECFPFVFELVPVQDLGFDGQLECQQFLTWPNLRHLRRLELYAPPWSDDDWIRFVECSALRDGLCVDVSASFPSVGVKERLERRFNIGFAAS
jgi:uncharacterized protein (TIGR02996 family)